MGDLNGKRVVLTGAGRGLGRVIAQTLAAGGARVALLGRTLSILEELAAELGGESFPLSMDVGDPDSVASAFAEIGDRFGEIDVLINCAALFPLGKVETTSA